MADAVGATYDNGQPAYWLEAGSGKPYKYAMVNGVEDRSKKVYMPLSSIDPYAEDPSKPQGSGVIKGHAQWDTDKGEWKQPTNWGNIMAIGVGGAMAAPFVAGALGGAAGASGAGGSSLLGEGGAAAGLSSTGATSGLIGGSAAAGAGAAGTAAAVPSALLGEGGSAAGLSSAGASSGLIGSTPALAASAVPGAGAIGTVPGAGATGTIPGSSVMSSVTPKWTDLLREGGQALTSGAQESANQDLVNNASRAQWLRAMDDDYKTKLSASVNVPAGLQRQALWSDFIQNAKSSDPNAPAHNLLTTGQQAMVGSQREAIMKKLGAANAMALPTAPEIPTYQEPGTGTKVASTLGTVANVASKVPWSKIAHLF